MYHNRALVLHRERGSEHLNKVLKDSSKTAFLIRRQEGRLGTSDLPIPPPSSPIPTITPHNIHPAPMPGTGRNVSIKHLGVVKEVKKTIRETKEILGERESQVKKKRKVTKTGKAQKVETGTSSDVKKLSINGEQQSVGKINKVDYVREMKKKDASEIREAENEIKEMVEAKRKVVPPLVKQKSSWAKDSHAFIRAHTTMSLSMLKEISRRQLILRRENEVLKKAEIVARVREEREVRKKRIHHNQQMIRDAITMWKTEEERRLQKKRDQLELEQEERRLQKAEDVEKMMEAMNKRREGEDLAVAFAQQQNMLEKLSHKEKTE